MRFFVRLTDLASSLILTQLVSTSLAAQNPELGHKISSRDSIERRGFPDWKDDLPFFEHKHQRVYRNDRRYEIQDIVKRIAERDIEKRETASETVEELQRREIAAEAQADALKLITHKDAYATYASALSAPTIASKKVLGPSLKNPSNEYLDQGGKKQSTPQLPQSVLVESANSTLTTDYPIDHSTGVLIVDAADKHELKPLTTKPTISRDGGRGGIVNGRNIFMFDDTTTSTKPSAYSDGQFTGFTPNSVAEELGSRGLQGKSLVLEDKVGEWANSKGAIRGFVPLTTGEQAYNAAMASTNSRYAIWPETSIVHLSNTTGLIYAPVLFSTGPSATPTYTHVGTTLVRITVPGAGGPVADRAVRLLFNTDDDEAEWGCFGALRSYDSTGAGGGTVFPIANAPGGLMIGRVPVADVADKAQYTFFRANGSWNPTRPTLSSGDVFISGAFSSGDVFYSPRHATFLAVYMTPFADNTLYIRHLLPPHPLYPQHIGGAPGFVESVTRYPWSESQVLLKLPTPEGGFAYAGGVHKGYFGVEDVTRGGRKMLVGWTAPTGSKPESSVTAYKFVTAVIEFE